MLSPETLLRNRYRVISKIGGGGFGYVYKAIDEVFGCTVAIKETKEQVAGADQLRRAFEREAKLLRNLKHDALPRVTDYFLYGQSQFLVMDFIEGSDLAALLKTRNAPSCAKLERSAQAISRSETNVCYPIESARSSRIRHSGSLGPFKAGSHDCLCAGHTRSIGSGRGKVDRTNRSSGRVRAQGRIEQSLICPTSTYRRHYIGDFAKRGKAW